MVSVMDCEMGSVQLLALFYVEYDLFLYFFFIDLFICLFLFIFSFEDSQWKIGEIQVIRSHLKGGC